MSYYISGRRRMFAVSRLRRKNGQFRSFRSGGKKQRFDFLRMGFEQKARIGRSYMDC